MRIDSNPTRSYSVAALNSGNCCTLEPMWVEVLRVCAGVGLTGRRNLLLTSRTCIASIMRWGLLVKRCSAFESNTAYILRVPSSWIQVSPQNCCWFVPSAQSMPTVHDVRCQNESSSQSARYRPTQYRRGSLTSNRKDECRKIAVE